MRYKQWISTFLAAILLLLSVLPVAGEQILYPYPDAEGDTVGAPSAMLLYMGVKPEQDVILYEKQADTRYQPGSLMRVAMLGYAMKYITDNNINMDTQTATYTLELFNHYVAGTDLHTALMKFGETWTLRDLMTVCAIQTAADCAVTLAAALGGSPEAFVAGLNEFSAALGCTNSHFTNVMGLNEEGQYMSARDVMTFTRYAMQYPEVQAMLELTDWAVKPVSGGTTRSWPTSNDMLRRSMSVYYTYAVGGRTGGTLTETSLMEYGSKDGYEYMSIVMGAQRKDDKGNLTYAAYADAKRLIRWGLIGFRYETLAHKSEPVGRIEVTDCAEKNSLPLVPAVDVTAVIPNDLDVNRITRKVTMDTQRCRAPVEKGTELATLELYVEDKLVASSRLIAGESASRNIVYAAWVRIKAFLFSGWFLLIAAVLLLLIGGYVLLNIQYNKKKRKNSRYK